MTGSKPTKATKETVTDALEAIVTDDALAIKATNPSVPNVWVVSASEDDHFHQVSPTNNHTAERSTHATELLLKQREYLHVVSIEDAPEAVTQAANGREVGQESLSAFETTQ